MTTAKSQIEAEIARVVGAGKAVAIETVDFADPDRPKTCLEVDFPILPVNQVATIEGNAGKPIYQMSKWWARRRSSVFRSILIAASTKAPTDPAQVAKVTWDMYYANHQKRASLARLKVADIFMGGGTTLVEGTRLGLQMWGTDLNPVAWFVVKNQFAEVTAAEITALLQDVEAEVKPAIMPLYACDCPRGHKGSWINAATGKREGPAFDPLALTPHQRRAYRYDGPEIIYVFWAKHGPCQMTGCGHRTPIMTNPVMAVKMISIKAWEDQRCEKCRKHFDVEQTDARMAPGVPLVIAATEKPFAVLDEKSAIRCPHCDHKQLMPLDLKKRKTKKIELTLLVPPSFLTGSASKAKDGMPFGGSATDSPEATAAWNRERAHKTRLLEVRGQLPDVVTCPDTGETFDPTRGTVPKKSHYACGACGTVQDVLESVKATGKTGPLAAYAFQGYCPTCDAEGRPYGGRFFSPVVHTAAFDAAALEWVSRKEQDLRFYWPRSEVPFGFMTSMNNGGIPNHGYTHWWTMFNERQLLVLSALLRSVCTVGEDRHRWQAREFVLGAFQQYLRNQNLFCIWDRDYDKLVPHMSNNNYHPKANMVRIVSSRRWGAGTGDHALMCCWRRSSGYMLPGSC